MASRPETNVNTVFNGLGVFSKEETAKWQCKNNVLQFLIPGLRKSNRHYNESKLASSKNWIEERRIGIARNLGMAVGETVVLSVKGSPYDDFDNPGNNPVFHGKRKADIATYVTSKKNEDGRQTEEFVIHISNSSTGKGHLFVVETSGSFDDIDNVPYGAKAPDAIFVIDVETGEHYDPQRLSFTENARMHETVAMSLNAIGFNLTFGTETTLE